MFFGLPIGMKASLRIPSVLKAVVEKSRNKWTLRPSSWETIPDCSAMAQTRRVFEKTGLMDAACGHYENIGNDSVKVDFNPVFLPSVSLSKAVVDADIIISLPKFKTHGLTVVTGAIKNSYGFLPGCTEGQPAQNCRDSPAFP